MNEIDKQYEEMKKLHDAGYPVKFMGQPISNFDTQVGGNHYKDLAIQPLEFIVANNLGFVEGNVVKYVVRYKVKNGLEDLKKARHYLDLLIELEEAKLNKE